jgi:hypothetical protein
MDRREGANGPSVSADYGNLLVARGRIELPTP